MYYHPLLLNASHNDRVLETCRAFAELWLDAAAEQQAIRRNAVAAFCSAHAENLQALSEAEDAADLVGHAFACAIAEPLRALRLAAQLAEAVADSHRRALALFDTHISTGRKAAAPNDVEPAHAMHVVDSTGTTRKQVMA